MSTAVYMTGFVLFDQSIADMNMINVGKHSKNIEPIAKQHMNVN